MRAAHNAEKANLEQQHATQVLDLLRQIEALKNVRLSRRNRIRFRRYMLDLWLSKIVVSPFGWGEVCYRDFETFGNGLASCQILDLPQGSVR